MKNIIKILLFLIFISHTAYSKDLISDNMQYEKMPVDIKADKLSQDNKNNLFIAEGNAEFHQGTRKLTADYIEYNLDTQLTKAKGNVKLQQGGDIIRCDAFEINLDTQVGQVHNADMFLNEGNFHIKGKEIEKISTDKYRILNGTITTCDAPNPPWRIDAKKINLAEEGYAHVKNAFLKIKGVPIFYLPYFVFPAKTERATGLLRPEYGTSSSAGYEFTNSFFWAISDSSDATYWLDYATRKGTGNGLEFRKRFKENSWVKLYGYHTNESKDFFDEEYSDTKDRNRERIYLNFEGEHYFSSDLYLKANANYISDREFYNDYSTEVRRSSLEYKESDIGSRERDESFLFLNKNWDKYNLLFNIDVNKNLYASDPNTLQRLPQLLFSGMRQEVTGTPLFYQLDASYDNLWRDTGVKGNRFTVFPKISLPKCFNGWLKFNPEIGLKGISYLDLNQNNNYDEEGVFPSIKAELSADFIKIFNFENGKIKKLKHTIEPGLLYEYLPENDQEQMPDFDIQDGFYKRNILSYYLKNRFTALYLNNTNSLTEKEMGYIMFGQSFNFSDPEGGIYFKGVQKEDGSYEEFSDIFGELRLNLLNGLYFKTKATYDPYNNGLNYYNALVRWKKNNSEFFNFEYSYRKYSYEDLDFSGGLKVYKPLHIFFDVRYDLDNDYDLDTDFGIDLKLGCWGTRVWVENNSASSGRKSETSVKFTIYLIGLNVNTQQSNKH